MFLFLFFSLLLSSLLFLILIPSSPSSLSTFPLFSLIFYLLIFLLLLPPYIITIHIILHISIFCSSSLTTFHNPLCSSFSFFILSSHLPSLFTSIQSSYILLFSSLSSDFLFLRLLLSFSPSYSFTSYSLLPFSPPPSHFLFLLLLIFKPPSSLPSLPSFTLLPLLFPFPLPPISSFFSNNLKKQRQ